MPPTPTPALQDEPLDELARLFARAAVDRLLAEDGKAPAEAPRRGPDQREGSQQHGKLSAPLHAAVPPPIA